MPEPDPARLAGKLLYVDEARPGGRPYLNEMFARVQRVAELPRQRGPLTIETYALDLLESARSEVLDRSPPPELQERVAGLTSGLRGAGQSMEPSPLF